MAGLLIVPGAWPVFDAAGDPVSGATISFFRSGTSTPIAVYSDSTLTTSLGSVLTTNAGGEPTTLAGIVAREWWCPSGQAYDVRIQATGLDRTWEDVPALAESNLFEFVDPRSYGLIVSSDTATTAGNTTAMQAALDTGKNIQLPDGDFWCGAVTQTTPRQVVMGTKKTRWRHPVGVTGLITISALAVGAVWTGFRIDGNRAAVTYAYNSSEFAVFASDVVLSWLELRDVQSMGIRGLNGSVRFKVQNCDVINAGDFGIFINNVGTGDDPEGCLVENCYVENFGIIGAGAGVSPSVGIGIRSSSGGSRCVNNRVKQTTAYTNDQLGIEFWTNSNNCVCNGNTIEFSGSGVGEFGISATGYGMTVNGNTIIGTDSYAIEIVDRAATVAGNTLRSPRGAGIAINLNSVHTDPGDCITVTGNTIENLTNTVNGGYAGIVVAGDSGVTPTAITISGNTIWGLSRLILVTNLVNGYTISGNMLYNPSGTLTPMVATGTRGSITGNTILRADVAGSLGSAMTIGGNIVNISGNTIAGDGASNRIDNGILINAGATNILVGPNLCIGATNYVFSNSTAASVVVQGGLGSTGLTLQSANRSINALSTSDSQSQTQNVAPAVGSYTVANLPTVNIQPGQMAYASNGRKNGEGAGSGTGVLVFRDGSAWRAVDTGATVAS